MDHAVPVRRVERVGHLAGEPQRVVERELALAIEAGAQRLALDVGHHVVEQAVDRAGGQHRQDVRMLKAGGDLDLADEAVGPEDRRQLGIEHLDRDRTVVPEVLGEEHRRRAAAAQLSFDQKGVGQGGPEALEEFGHASTPSSSNPGPARTRVP